MIWDMIHSLYHFLSARVWLGEAYWLDMLIDDWVPSTGTRLGCVVQDHFTLNQQIGEMQQVITQIECRTK